MKIISSIKLLDSFKFAIRGIIYCINNERNMRIHTVATVLVFVISLFFEISPVKYAILILTIALVMSCEMLNTATEELTDMSSETYSPMARIAKDVAAGAVFICAIFSVAIAAIIFWQPEGFVRIYEFFIEQPIMVVPLILFFIIAFLYIKLGPIGMKEVFYQIRRKKRTLF